jgi:hypothetical protein
MGALICNNLPDEASGVHEDSTMNRQDGHLQFDPERSNLRSYAHSQLRREQAKRGSSPEMGGKQTFGGPIDCIVGNLCNHVGFTDVAAPRGCLNKKSR